MKQRQLRFKRNICFFPKIYSKARQFCAKFLFKIKNKCWKRGYFKMNIIHNPVKITKCRIYTTVAKLRLLLPFHQVIFCKMKDINISMKGIRTTGLFPFHQ